MLFLNLDSSFKPFVGDEITYKSFTFAGGEPHIKIESSFSKEKVVVTHRLQSFNDLGLLCVAIDALQRMEVRSIDLFIPYFPAARQDRLMMAGEPLTVKVYTDIINAMNLNKVMVFDPHSEVTPALLNNCQVITNYNFISDVIKQLGEVKLVSPDGGL